MNLFGVDRQNLTIDPRIEVDEFAVSLLIDNFEIGMRSGAAKTAENNSK